MTNRKLVLGIEGKFYDFKFEEDAITVLNLLRTAKQRNYVPRLNEDGTSDWNNAKFVWESINDLSLQMTEVDNNSNNTEVPF